MRYQDQYSEQRFVEAHPPRRSRFNPHFTIWVAIPIVLGSLFLLYYATQAIGWMHEHWGSVQPWAIVAAIAGAIGLLARPIWKMYRALHEHHQNALDRVVWRDVAKETQYLLQEARKRGDGVKISGNANGAFPSIEILPLVAAATRQREQVSISAADEEAVLALPAPRKLPEYVAYEDVKPYIPKGHALLGVSETGIESCDFGDLMTMMICGGSNSGKSNTVALKIDEAIHLGRNIGIICIDPHARKPDSLWNKIKVYADRFLMPVAYKEEQMLAALEWFLEEYERRLEQGYGDTDILLVVDEVQHITRFSEEVTKLLKKISAICGQESRGFGMFGWFISQNAVGLPWLRNVVLTVIVHKMLQMNDRLLAVNGNGPLARSMDNWPKHGRVAVYSINLEGFRVCQMAAFKAPQLAPPADPRAVYQDTTEVDLNARVVQAGGLEEMEELQPKTQPASPVFRAETPRRNAETLSRSGDETAFEADADDHKIIPLRASENLGELSSKKKIQSASDVSVETKKIIVRMHKKGIPHRDIAPLVGLGGELYNIFKEVCQELGIKQQLQKGADESEAL
jgi:hypothetical protein